jgi:hypothetical protein
MFNLPFVRSYSQGLPVGCNAWADFVNKLAIERRLTSTEAAAKE